MIHLNTILANTDVITTTINVYRFDFPSIYTYTGSFTSADSTTQIANDTYATTEEVSEKSSPIRITGNIVVSGNFISDGGNVGTISAV
jgi:hypothetical protein